MAAKKFSTRKDTQRKEVKVSIGFKIKANSTDNQIWAKAETLAIKAGLKKLGIRNYLRCATEWPRYVVISKGNWAYIKARVAILFWYK